LLILAYVKGSISAVDRTGTVVWNRDDLGANGLVLKSCQFASVMADVEDWEGNWRTIRLAEVDGSDLE
jgi:hypothetical protein